MTNDELRGATGHVRDPRPLVGFLYDLMRDHLPVGTVKVLVDDSEAIGPDNPCLFTNGHLADYAKLLADRLAPAPAPAAGAVSTMRFKVLMHQTDHVSGDEEIYDSVDAVLHEIVNWHGWQTFGHFEAALRRWITKAEPGDTFKVNRLAVIVLVRGPACVRTSAPTVAGDPS